MTYGIWAVVLSNAFSFSVNMTFWAFTRKEKPRSASLNLIAAIANASAATLGLYALGVSRG